MTLQEYLNEHRDEIASSSPTHLVVMLYDEAIHQLGLSIKAIKAGDIAARFNAVALTANLIEQLHSTLDFAQGGELAEQLGTVYRFVMNHLPRLNLYNDSEMAAQIIGILEPLRDSWHALEQHLATQEAQREAEERVAAVA